MHIVLVPSLSVIPMNFVLSRHIFSLIPAYTYNRMNGKKKPKAHPRPSHVESFPAWDLQQTPGKANKTHICCATKWNAPI